MAARGALGCLQARCLLVGAALLLLLSGGTVVVAESSVHTVFTTECSKYFSWQTMGGCRGRTWPVVGERAGRSSSCMQISPTRWQCAPFPP